MPHPLVELVRCALAEAGALEERLLVGVSGGADSVALVCAAREILSADRITVAHLNHSLRGADSEADAAWVATLAAELQVAAILETADVAELARRERTGLEEAARSARYAFFIESAATAGTKFVAVAHTADDQAETVLHHILRGTGLSGLAGIPPTRELNDGLTLIRPLLRVRRAMVEDYLASRRQTFRLDATNAGSEFTRNRIRNDLIPHLTARYNPQIVSRLNALADQARDAQTAIAQQARELLGQAVRVEPTGEVSVDLTPLQHQSRHVVRELFVELWKRQRWPRQAMDQRHWDALATLALDGGTALHLPGALEARRKRGTLTLRKMTPFSR